MVATHFRTAESSLGHPNVDFDSGIIRNVSIITVGEARGHGVFIDQTTLAQVKASAESFTTGLGVKFNPQTFNHGNAGLAGNVQNLRIVSNRLLGDLKVLSTYPARDYLLELAATQPDSFGLSIDFDLYTENIGGQDFARCAGIDAVTVVDVPAANPNGLFQAGHQRPFPIHLFKSSQAMQTTLNTATAFAASIKTFMRKGNSRGKAILLAVNKDRTGFNAWCAEGRPMPDEPHKAGLSAGSGSSYLSKHFKISGQPSSVMSHIKTTGA